MAAVRSEHWVNAISCWMALRWDDDSPAIWEDDWEWENGGWDGGDECVKLCPSMPRLEISRYHLLLGSFGMEWDYHAAQCSGGRATGCRVGVDIATSAVGASDVTWRSGAGKIGAALACGVRR